MLAGIYNWFIECFEHEDLKDAKKLLSMNGVRSITAAGSYDPWQ